MDKKKILVVDDERDLCEILLYNLRAAGHEVDAVYSAEEALQQDLQAYSLLLLDVMLPGMSGFQLAERLRQQEHLLTPIIFLTAKDTEDDTLRGFGLGADDYITKPFSVREVVARVKAVLNRSEAKEAVRNFQLLSYKGLEVDLSRKTVVVDGEETSLTKTELELLSLLLQHRGHVLSRQQLLEGAWPKNVVVTDRTVDVNITRLRKKIGRYGQSVVARQGFGYCFLAEE